MVDTNGTHIVHITDTTDRNARLKLESAYVKHTRNREYLRAAVSVVPATNTLDIGAVVSELVNNTERPERLVIAVNCAGPDRPEGTVNNARNDFFCARLDGNTVVCGTSNGHEFSYVKDQIQDFYRLTNTNHKGSQFRSLEILPEYAIRFSRKRERGQLVSANILTPERVADIVPVVPDVTHVFEVDNFKNVKLHLSRDDRLRLDHSRGHVIAVQFDAASIEFGTPALREATPALKSFPARVTETLFAAPLGTNLIAQSSSSRLSGGLSVPIIATIRERPGETEPNYPVPKVGAKVWLNFLPGTNYHI